jgi:hypothetical protein
MWRQSWILEISLSSSMLLRWSGERISEIFLIPRKVGRSPTYHITTFVTNYEFPFDIPVKVKVKFTLQQALKA